jgi:cytidylate kinase
MTNIAIDGPAGAGKSTLSRMLAEMLGFIYTDTGALYRAIGLFALEHGVAANDATGVAALLPDIKLGLDFNEHGQRVMLCGEDVSEKIRRPEISMAASDASAIPAVRAFLLGLQKDIAASNNVVMDGRDIGTVVLPDAQLKIFLTASPQDRARRRYDELITKGMQADYERVLADIISRDGQDSGREIAPLKPAADAVIVDTTGFEIDDSIRKLFEIAKERLSLK